MASLLLLLGVAALCGERCAAVFPVLGPDRVLEIVSREVLAELVCCPQRIHIATWPHGTGSAPAPLHRVSSNAGGRSRPRGSTWQRKARHERAGREAGAGTGRGGRERAGAARLRGCRQRRTGQCAPHQLPAARVDLREQNNACQVVPLTMGSCTWRSTRTASGHTEGRASSRAAVHRGLISGLASSRPGRCLHTLRLPGAPKAEGSAHKSCVWQRCGGGVGVARSWRVSAQG